MVATLHPAGLPVADSGEEKDKSASLISLRRFTGWILSCVWALWHGASGTAAISSRADSPHHSPGVQRLTAHAAGQSVVRRARVIVLAGALMAALFLAMSAMPAVEHTPPPKELHLPSAEEPHTLIQQRETEPGVLSIDDEQQQRSDGEEVDAQQQEEGSSANAVYEDLSSTFPDGTARRAYRRAVIVQEIKFSFDGYRRCAWGHDEARPVTCGFRDWAELDDQRRPAGNAEQEQTQDDANGNEAETTGLAMTMVDSLSTLILADLSDEVEEVLRFLNTRPNLFDVDMSVSQFESTIRLLGGLLSAYELRGETDTILIALARNLGERILMAFRTKTFLPNTLVNLRTGASRNRHWHLTSVFLSEVGTNALEFRTLSYHTGVSRFAEASARVNALMSEKCPPSQLCPTHYDQSKEQFANQDVSLGGLADSYFEYLLKMYVHSGFADLPAASRFVKFFESALQQRLVVMHPAAPPRCAAVAGDSVPSACDRFVRQPAARAWINFLAAGRPIAKMDHLSCFAGGLFRLAAETLDFGAPSFNMLREQQHVQMAADTMRTSLRDAAVGITQTCADLYANSPTRLAPEVASLANAERVESARAMHGAQPYVLRPEAIESLFYQHYFDFGPTAAASRATASTLEEEQAWRMFLAIRASCRVENGYSGIHDVSKREKGMHDDVMQSFWISETLKYLLLIFTEQSTETAGSRSVGPKGFLDLRRDWVLNTEAHPLRIRRNLMDKIPGF